MTTQTTKPLAVDVCKDFHLSRRGRDLLGDSLTVGAFMKALVSEHLWPDAMRLNGHAFPTRKAVWWGCLCVRHTAGEPPVPAEHAALLSAVRWVIAPSEENRRRAFDAAQPLSSQSASGCVALAAYHGGVLAALQDGHHSVSSARLVSAAVLLAAGAGDDMMLHYRQFLFLALRVANDQNKWE